MKICKNKEMEYLKERMYELSQDIYILKTQMAETLNLSVLKDKMEKDDFDGCVAKAILMCRGYMGVTSFKDIKPTHEEFDFAQKLYFRVKR